MLKAFRGCTQIPVYLNNDSPPLPARFSYRRCAVMSFPAMLTGLLALLLIITLT